MAELPDAVTRINALTTNARNTWFALLGVLVFVGVTLMGVEHIDFYGVNRATKLPLIGVDIPTRYFFVAAPIVTAAFYGYFHLYLIRLWDALGAAPTRINGARLGDAITPWLVSDAALQLRLMLRGDNCTTPRALEISAMALNFLLAWGLGLILMFFIWWLSMPARTIWITGISGAALVLSLLTGAASLTAIVLRMSSTRIIRVTNLWSTLATIASLLIAGPVVGYYSQQRTMGPTNALAPLNLTGEQIVERPEGWLPHAVARAEFRATWCAREKMLDCTDFGDRKEAFKTEWQARRTAALSDMRRPDWHKTGRDKPNLRDATLPSAFLPGVDLRRAQMQGAVLRRAQMQGADLRRAQMQGADLSDAQMERAVLSEAQMQGAVLWRAQMQGADLSFSLLTGDPQTSDTLFETNLRASINNGGALRFVDLRTLEFDAKTDFRNVFLDATVTYTDAFARQMGGDDPKPCQWIDRELSEEDFYAHWRWWIEANPNPGMFDSWTFIAPPKWHNVPVPENPPENCHWQTDPMPPAD